MPREPEGGREEGSSAGAQVKAFPLSAASFSSSIDTDSEEGGKPAEGVGKALDASAQPRPRPPGGLNRQHSQHSAGASDEEDMGLTMPSVLPRLLEQQATTTSSSHTSSSRKLPEAPVASGSQRFREVSLRNAAWKELFRMPLETRRN